MPGVPPSVTDEAERPTGSWGVIDDQVNGLLFAHDDERQLAGVLARVLSDAPLRRRLARAAREHVEKRHDLDRIAAGLVELFQNLRASSSVVPQAS